MEPVGEGAIRVTTGWSGIELEAGGEEAARAADAWAAPLSTPQEAASSAVRLRRWLAAQAAAQADRWTLWNPVALGLGAAAYFALPKEPLSWVAAVALGLAAAFVWAARTRASRRASVAAFTLAAFALAGFAAGKIRTEQVKAPIAVDGGRPQVVEGWVVDVASPGAGGQRLLIAPVRIGDWPAEATPIRLRVTLRDGGEIPPPGSAIRVLAMINPPPPPASPGAYDFGRDAFFDSIGGVGFTLGRPEAADLPDRPPWRLRWAMGLNAMRWALALQIVDVMGPDTGGLAAAMTSGHEAFIPSQQVDDLRAAGLAHIISISGLHMAIVGGFIFAVVRLLIAAWPWLALRVPGKKVAAAAGLVAVGSYLLISGAPPPAERAAITAAVAFGAMLADRQAISLHSLSLAALAILLLQPDAVTAPGFQMSFAATAALVALAEGWPRPAREINTPWPIRAVQGAGLWIVASIAASFVAGLATGPFSMQHFNRVSMWGLVSNLLVAPISSFLMMPALALGAALTPLGLGDGPLAAASLGISLMNRIAHAAANAPHAVMTVASAPAWTLPAAFLGILWLCLWKGRLRWAGLPFALAVALVPRPSTPDLWIAADGAAAAVRIGDQAVLFRPDVKRFAAELWARRRGLAPTENETPRDAVFDCDRWSCAPGSSGGGPSVAMVWSKKPVAADRLTALCARAEVVIIRGDADPAVCPRGVVLTASDFERGGSAELYRRNSGWRVVWAQHLRGRRPWSWGAG
jgi:competence protein ComEC